MRTLIALTPLALAACVTPLDDIRQREVQDDITTARALPAVRDCLLETLGVGRNPIVTGDNSRAEVVFQTADAGAIFHYELTATTTGTRVIARRKNNIANGFDDARACYPAG